jgi:hypothetical protein
MTNKLPDTSLSGEVLQELVLEVHSFIFHIDKKKKKNTFLEFSAFYFWYAHLGQGGVKMVRREVRTYTFTLVSLYKS